MEFLCSNCLFPLSMDSWHLFFSLWCIVNSLSKTKTNKQNRQKILESRPWNTEFFPAKTSVNTTSRFTLRRGGLLLNGYLPCLIYVWRVRILQFFACHATDAVVPGLSNPEMFLLLCLLTAWGKIVKPSGVFSFLFSCFKSFWIDYFGLSNNGSHNLPEAEQQC